MIFGMSTPIHVHSVPLGPMKNLVHILFCELSNQCAVIDPAWDANAILKQIDALNGKLSMILLTHTHFDHINALDGVMKEFQCPVYGSVNASIILSETHDVYPLKNDTVVNLGNNHIKAIETPGHSPCGMCYYLAPHLMVGDTLFVNGCGRADLPGSDPAALHGSITTLAGLPGNTIIYPGHDYGPTPTDTLNNQKQTNPFLGCDQASFLRKRMGRR